MRRCDELYTRNSTQRQRKTSCFVQRTRVELNQPDLGAIFAEHTIVPFRQRQRVCRRWNRSRLSAAKRRVENEIAREQQRDTSKQTIGRIPIDVLAQSHERIHSAGCCRRRIRRRRHHRLASQTARPGGRTCQNCGASCRRSECRAPPESA